MRGFSTGRRSGKGLIRQRPASPMPCPTIAARKKPVEDWMAYELLRKIAGASLPMTLSSQADIERLRILRDAGYVKADLPPEGAPSASAVVIALTPLGRTAMRYFGGG
ncbi:hypothetical protein [Variovorax sp. WS11]|uniref:hypothetical protein n=2 Tax=Comamonadaceae TaxID=80864 RepID=UPI0013DC9622|nr:hypothetical protein [Variovorax sp. WS11]NDZ16126.1 hypothetical protein [Variovorax sp. WS11]